MSNSILPSKVYCPKCKRQHEVPVCIPLQKAFLTVCVALCILVLLILPAQAATSNVTLTRLPDEIVDTNGQQITNAVFYLDCDGEVLTVSIAVTFSDGAVVLLTSDNYCGAKFYVEGFVSLAQVAGVASGEVRSCESCILLL